MFYLMMHSVHFSCLFMTAEIWLWNKARKLTATMLIFSTIKQQGMGENYLHAHIHKGSGIHGMVIWCLKYSLICSISMCGTARSTDCNCKLLFKLHGRNRRRCLCVKTNSWAAITQTVWNKTVFKHKSITIKSCSSYTGRHCAII